MPVFCQLLLVFSNGSRRATNFFLSIYTSVIGEAFQTAFHVKYMGGKLQFEWEGGCYTPTPAQDAIRPGRLEDGLSPCNSWWGWGIEALKWHLLSLHLWSHWSHWSLIKKKEDQIKRKPIILYIILWRQLKFEINNHILDGNLGPLSVVRFKVHKNFQDGLGPIGAIGQKTEVRKWLLWSSCFPFYLGKLVTCKTHSK